MDIKALHPSGWFAGPFEGAAFATTNCEACAKSYKAGETNAAHFHKGADEITLVVSGSCRMGDAILGPGQVAIVPRGEISDFEALSDCLLFVLKVPGVLDDKYPAEEA